MITNMQDEIDIRSAHINDIPSVRKLVIELAVFEKEPDAVTVSEEQYITDFSEGLFDSIVAEYRGNVVGAMIFYTVYSTWKGKMVYLEDFIITEDFRRKGIGTMMFKQFTTYCQSIQANLAKWQVLDWNQSAISFYENYETSFEDEWLNVKLVFYK